MRTLRIPPDAAIVSILMGACRRHCDVEVVLRLRAELLSLGWSPRHMRGEDELLLQSNLLPSLAEVMANPMRWAALGVRPASGITSEQSELSLSLDGIRESDEREGGAEGERGVRRREAAVADAEEREARLRPTPATAGQEIWERKGWNQVGSGWRPF
jgi:hypothetical protein